MSEYWKSTPKYWCKHCTTYVRDTTFERKQHESTAKHQNNLKRFLRDIQNDHERETREKQKAKAEVERLNRIAGGGSVLAPSTASTPSFRKDKTGPRTQDDQKRQWQELANLGIRVPDHVQAEMAMVGSWKSVPQQAEEPLEDSLSVGIRKRKLEEDEDEEHNETLASLSNKKVWGKSVRSLTADNDDNLDALLSTNILLKKEKPDVDVVTPKREPIGSSSIAHTAESPNSDTVGTSELPAPAPSEREATGSREVAASPAPVITNESNDSEEKPVINKVSLETSPLPVFKKRKAKATPAT